MPTKYEPKNEIVGKNNIHSRTLVDKIGIPKLGRGSVIVPFEQICIKDHKDDKAYSRHNVDR